VSTAVKVNDVMIPSKALGQVVGADYEYTDTTAEQWPTYHYWLQDVGQGGSKHYLGSSSWYMPKALRVYPASGSKPFRGTHNIYLRAVDAPGNDMGWVLVGTWTVE